jgi:hypothetical protein
MPLRAPQQGMRVEVDFEGGKNAAGIYVHKKLPEAMGNSVAAFAHAVLSGHTQPGVWYPEEKEALSVRSRVAGGGRWRCAASTPTPTRCCRQRQLSGRGAMCVPTLTHLCPCVLPHTHSINPSTGPARVPAVCRQGLLAL